MYIEQEFDFDDVLILPSMTSDVDSRNDVSLSQWIGGNRTYNTGNTVKTGFQLDIPIIASPMKGIVDTELIIKLSKLGGIGILHRFMHYPEFSSKVNELYHSGEHFGIAVPLQDKEERYKLALDAGANIICIDTANGHLLSVMRETTRLADYIWEQQYNSLLMVGNVVTSDTYDSLRECGADLIRVGIGAGALCTTRNQTGIGRPQISALLDCFNFNGVVADGGIRNSGDIVKALCAGAETVMIGSLFATTYESSNDGVIYGMASKTLQEDFYDTVKSIEGMEKALVPSQSLAELIKELTDNIKSAAGYLGAKSISGMRAKARFVQAGRGSIKQL